MAASIFDANRRDPHSPSLRVESSFVILKGEPYNEGRMKLFCVLLGCLLSVQGWAGDLTWERTVIEVTPEKGQKKVEGEFPFTNTSSGPVEIRDVQTSCGCTTAELPKKVYQAGERGTLKAVFTPGGRRGEQKKTIVVRTGAAKPDVLLLRVEIPETFTLDRPFLDWKVNAPNTPQVIEVAMTEPAAKLKSVKSLNKGFEAVLETVEAGKRYRITVKPNSTSGIVRGKVALEVDEPGKRVVYVPVEVKE